MATALYKKSGDTTFKRVTGEPPITVSDLSVAGEYEASKGDGTLVTATIAIQQPTQMDPPLLWGTVEEASITLRAADDETNVTGYEFEVDLTSGDYSSPPYSGTQSVANFGDPIDLPTVTPGTYKVRSRSLTSGAPYLWSEDAIMEVYATANTTTVSKDGMDFIFGGVHTHGQDATGYPWLLNETGGPIPLIKTTPEFNTISGTLSGGFSYTNRDINGLMYNPIDTVPDDKSTNEAKNGYPQGWDSLPSDGVLTASYSSAINVDPKKNRTPYMIEEGTLIKAISHAVPLDSLGREGIKTMAPVTVVTQAIPATAIVGHARNTAEALEYTTDDINLNVLPSRSVPAGETAPETIATLTSDFAQTSQYLTSGDSARGSQPTDAAPSYGGQNERGLVRGEAINALTLDYTNTEKLDLAKYVCHEAICLMRSVKTGRAWTANGAIRNGRYTVVLAGAALLDDATMKSMVSETGTFDLYRNKLRWLELGQVTRLDTDDTFDVEGGAFSFNDDPFQDFPGTSGFAEGDILTLTGGVTFNGNPGTFTVTSVGGSGEILDVSQRYEAFYFSPPTGLSTDGAGTGLTYDGTTGRKFRAVMFGMEGEIEYGARYVSLESPSPINAARKESYRFANRRANTLALASLFQITGVETIVGGSGDIWAYLERSFFFDDSSRVGVEQLSSFEEAYVEEAMGYTDPGAPVALSFHCNRNVAWIKYDQLLKEGYNGGPSVPGDFTVNVNGSPVGVVESFSFGKSLNLSLDTFITEADTVTIAYTKTASPDAVQNVFGTEAANISATTATNETVDFVDPVPNSILPDSNFLDPWNNYQTPSSAFRLISGEGFNRRFIDDQALQTSRPTVTAGQSYEFSFFCRDAANSTGLRFEYFWYDDNGKISEGTLGGSTFDPVEGVNVMGTRTAPTGTGPTRLQVDITSVFGREYTVEWLSVEPVA